MMGYVVGAESADFIYFKIDKDGEIIYDHPVKSTDLKDEPGDFPWNYSEDREYVWHISAKNGFEMLFSECEIKKNREFREKMDKKSYFKNFDKWPEFVLHIEECETWGKN